MPVIEIEDENQVTQVGSCPPSDLDDTDLLAEIGRLIAEAHMIDAQVADDRDLGSLRGTAWLIRAKTKRRFTTREYEIAYAEALSRGMTNIPDIDPNRQAKNMALAGVLRSSQTKKERAAANLAENERLRKVAEERRAQRLAEHEERMKRERDRENPFVLAAQIVLDKTTYLSIWEKARELYPDHPRLQDCGCVVPVKEG